MISNSKLSEVRLPPHDLNAERCLLGSIFIQSSMLDEVALMVRVEDFYLETHQVLFENMLAMHNAGKRIDLALIVAKLKKNGDYKKIGGEEFLLGIVESVPIATNAKWYAKIIADHSISRSVTQAAEQMCREVYDPILEPNEVLARSEARLFSISERACGSESKSISEVLLAAMNAVDLRKAGGTTMIKTGYHDLDKMIGGFGAGQLIILAGRPHMGKTALATCLIENIGEQGKIILFVSLEMNDLEIGDRLLAQRSKVPLENLTQGTMTTEQRTLLVEASSDWSMMKLTIDDHATRSVSQIASICRREKRKNGLDLVVIDYLTNIEPDNPREPRQEQVAKLSRRLKAMARELKIPVLCLAQLNREVEKNQNPIPRLSHLRESGAIEQDADVVMMIHRPEYFAVNEDEKSKLKGIAEIYVRKARNAKTGTVPLTFIDSYGRFESHCKDGRDVRYPQKVEQWDLT